MAAGSVGSSLKKERRKRPVDATSQDARSGVLTTTRAFTIDSIGTLRAAAYLHLWPESTVDFPPQPLLGVLKANGSHQPEPDSWNDDCYWPIERVLGYLFTTLMAGNKDRALRDRHFTVTPPSRSWQDCVACPHPSRAPAPCDTPAAAAARRAAAG